MGGSIVVIMAELVRYILQCFIIPDSLSVTMSVVSNRWKKEHVGLQTIGLVLGGVRVLGLHVDTTAHFF